MARVRGQGTAQMAGSHRSQDVVYRIRLSWEKGYCESFNSKLRDEFLNGEIIYSLKEGQLLAERWRVYYNTARPHSSLGYRPLAPAAWEVERNMGHRKVKAKPLPTFPCPRLRLSD